MDLSVDISLPVLWGGQVFRKATWGRLNFVVGPNGTGKTLFAEQLRDKLNAHNLRTRYLNAERLTGLERHASTQFGYSQVAQGFAIDRFASYLSEGETSGAGADAFVVLKEKLDVRLRIEVTLFQLFGRRMRLAEESGFLRPRLQRVNGGAEYQMRDAEAQGLKELIVLLTFLYDDAHRCLIIDEPELHLHPQFQALVVQEVRRLAGDPRADPAKKLFVLITHSPYVVDVRTLDELRHTLVFRPGRPPAPLDLAEPDDAYRVRRLLPRLNTHHKQFFFATRPVFVEGYQDQQLYTLIQERRGAMLGASGASIIDVGGKEELDVFFRLGTRLGLDVQVIVDLDAMLEGKLRQTVAVHPQACAYAIRQGFGATLAEAHGQLEREAAALADAVEAALESCAAREALSADLGALAAVLGAAGRLPDATQKLRQRRYCMLLAVRRVRPALAAAAPELASRLDALAGRLEQVVAAWRGAGVHVLADGELENYLPSYTGDLYRVPNATKAAAFEAERDWILTAEPSAADLVLRYPELCRVLNRAARGPAISLDAQLNLTLGGWIHEVQSGFVRGMVHDLPTLQGYASADMTVMARVLEPLEFMATSVTPINDDGNDGRAAGAGTDGARAGFTCRVRLRETVDPDRREFTFTDGNVAAKFRLPPPAVDPPAGALTAHEPRNV